MRELIGKYFILKVKNDIHVGKIIDIKKVEDKEFIEIEGLSIGEVKRYLYSNDKGETEGKVRIGRSKIYLKEPCSTIREKHANAEIFLHIRGYSGALENHVDVEFDDAKTFGWHFYEGLYGDNYGEAYFYYWGDEKKIEIRNENPIGCLNSLFIQLDDSRLFDICFTKTYKHGEEINEWKYICKVGVKSSGIWIEVPTETNSSYIDNAIHELYGIRPKNYLDFQI